MSDHDQRGVKRGVTMSSSQSLDLHALPAQTSANRHCSSSGGDNSQFAPASIASNKLLQK